VQNKMHWAVHGHTAAEVIVARADAAKPNMGLTSWEGARPRRQDVEIAKNYLGPDELDALNRIVNLYLEFAEGQALRRRPMTMAQWIGKLDDFLRIMDRDVLGHAGKVSRDKALAKAHAATLNDMVLMLCAGALRSYLQQRTQLPRKSLVAAVPISLRQTGDVRSDNQASMSLISLGTHLADPAKRLAHILAASSAMKTTMGPMKSILPTDFPSIGIPWLMEAAASLYGKARMAERLPQVANVVISNVPGPQVPIYLAGARVRANCPTSIVVHGLALNITVQSFDAHMDFGLMADAAALPDVRALAAALDGAWDELRALPVPATLPKVSRTRLPSRVSAPAPRQRAR